MRDNEPDNDPIKMEVNQPIIKVNDRKLVQRARLNKFGSGSNVGKSNVSIGHKSNFSRNSSDKKSTQAPYQTLNYAKNSESFRNTNNASTNSAN